MLLRLISPPLWAALFVALTYWLALLLPFAQDLPEWRHKPAGAIVMAAGVALLFLGMASSSSPARNCSRMRP